MVVLSTQYLLIRHLKRASANVRPRLVKSKCLGKWRLSTLLVNIRSMYPGEET